MTGEMRYCMVCGGRLMVMLERIRDDNVPKDPYEAWNRNFRIAIELLPEARQFAEDTMMDCIKQ